ncbi:hypothetical protein NEOLI_002857 [Neolecta irregularis DAH-3]|uniref:Uncharacterized protein n=1 Tax=Neolecta irregularis (strain DAH-3) TaxID=1198029 RepID=A0A1U7LQB0_NEOID|nr:hypothetical protein NEOLI_002857 [Neolecta irregularis DAH-3]|eukprot:OLL24860.1 hypothetical protein NEOLI_002857 [Neolecta irregularis DAH-3]
MVTALAAEAAPTPSAVPAAAPTSSGAPAAAPTPSAVPTPPVARRSNDIQKRGFFDGLFQNISSKLSGVASTLLNVATKYGPSVVSGVKAGISSYFAQAGERAV